MIKIIFTSHAKLRLKQRRLTEQLIRQTILYPNSYCSGKEPNSIEYTKHFGERTITVITKPTKEGDLLVVSAWIDPPYPGTLDHKKQQTYKEFKKASFWGKIWISLLKTFGLK